MAEIGGFDLSVVIPCRNQTKMLRKTFQDIATYQKRSDLNMEIIYVDSYSDDGSLDVAKESGKVVKNLTILQASDIGVPKEISGKGTAVQMGMKAAMGNIRIFMDADSATPFDEIDKLLPYFKKNYDVVMGSRYTDKPLPATNSTAKALLKATKEVFEVIIYGSPKSNTTLKKQGRLRQFISRGGNLAFVVLLGQSFADTRCGFKAYTKDAAKVLFDKQRLPGFGFDTEILVIAKKYNFKIIEVPVKWIDDAEEANVTLGDGLKTFLEIFKIRWNSLSGKYSKAG